MTDNERMLLHALTATTAALEQADRMYHDCVDNTAYRVTRWAKRAAKSRDVIAAVKEDQHD